MEEERDGWCGTYRPLDTAMPVWIRVPLVLPPARVAATRGVPLRVRAAGIDNSATVAGQLLSWHQTLTGDWWALTQFEVTNRNQRARLPLAQLLPEAAVCPLE